MLGFAAVNTGNNLLYLLVSVLLGFLAVTGWCGHRNLTRLSLDLLPAQDLYARLPGKVRLLLKNHHRRLPLFLLQVAIADAKILVPHVAPGASATATVPLVMAQRGLQTLPQITVSSCFPVNFFVRSCQIELTHPLLVFPQPLTTDFPSGSDARKVTAHLKSPLPGGDGDLRNIDNYRPGDPLKSIHWKLSARQQELKTRQLYQQAERAVIFDPDQLPGLLEERLGRCAYLVNACCAGNRAVGLRIKARNIPAAVGRRHQLRLLKELALYE